MPSTTSCCRISCRIRGWSALPQWTNHNTTAHYAQIDWPTKTSNTNIRRQIHLLWHLQLHCQTKKSKSMYIIFYWVKYWTRQGHFFFYWVPGKTNKAEYFIKHHPPIHHTAIRHEYFHKSSQSLSFVPLWGFIIHILVLTIPYMIHESGGPNSNHKEPGGSKSDCLALVPKENCQNSNHQCSEKLHLQSYLEMLGSKTGCFGILGNNIILVIILLDLIER